MTEPVRGEWSLMPEESISTAQWLYAAGLVIAAILAGFIAHRVLFALGRRVVGRLPSRLDDALLRYSFRPAGLLFPALAVLLVVPLLNLTPGIVAVTRHGVGLVMIAAGAWLLVSLSQILEDVLSLKYDIAAADNAQARRVMTQARILRGALGVLIWIIAAASMLMTFDGVQELGASLLASAGLAGIAVGFAAKPVLSNLIAGIQIALTQPIRLDDVVIIDGEFGRVEEIRTTYVVVRLWDLRRMIVPLTWFIENPFQNWTYTSAEVIGSAFLVVDYTVPVEEVRAELKRIVEAAPEYSGTACALHVTEVTGQGVQLRAIMSARNAGAAFDLRCKVREALVAMIREKYPHALNRLRVEFDSAAPGGRSPLPV